MYARTLRSREEHHREKARSGSEQSSCFDDDGGGDGNGEDLLIRALWLTVKLDLVHRSR